MITQEQLKDLLHYDKETGGFTWLVSKGTARKGSEAGSVRIKSGKKYRWIQVLGRQCSAHRLAFLYMTGEFPENDVDHRDGNGLNNEWSNLREATPAENARNQRLSKRNRSGVVGVRWLQDRRKWKASIGVNGRTKHIGFFSNKGDAIAARKAADIEFGYHPNHGKNRPL
jgi:hypothetical protein